MALPSGVSVESAASRFSRDVVMSLTDESDHSQMRAPHGANR
jgi:hypothetical protein